MNGYCHFLQHNARASPAVGRAFRRAKPQQIGSHLSTDREGISYGIPRHYREVRRNRREVLRQRQQSKRWRLAHSSESGRRTPSQACGPPTPKPHSGSSEHSTVINPEGKPEGSRVPDGVGPQRKQPEDPISAIRSLLDQLFPPTTFERKAAQDPLGAMDKPPSTRIRCSRLLHVCNSLHSS